MLSLSKKPKRKPHTEAFLKLTIKNKQFDEAIDAITRSHKTTGFNPRGLMLLGESGVGKSTLVNNYRRKFPDIIHDDRTERPILYISLHHRVTVNDILCALLEVCGDPEPDKGTARSLIMRFNRLAKSLGVQLIIIDEIQHVLPEHTQRRTQEAADAIKSISADTKTPFILIGLPHGVRLLTDTLHTRREEDQLIRRFNAPINLEPAELGSATWKNIMRGYQKAIGVPCINLTTEEMLKRFHLATRGLHGFVSTLLEHALEDTDGKTQISMEHLARSYDISTGILSQTGNPFQLTLAQVDRALALRNG